MQNGNKVVRDLTQGSVPKVLITFAIPFMLSNLLQVLYSLVDMVVVGQVLGSSGLSAVSTASQVFIFMTMLSTGFSTGGQVYVSQLIGAGKREKLRGAIGTLFTCLFCLGCVMMVFGLVFSTNILKLLNTPSESFAMAQDYMLVCSLGILFSYGYNMVSAVLRGMGNSKQPFIFIAIASVINLILDVLFCVYFRWGVAGAALATIIGQAFSFIYALIYLYRNREDFGFDFKLRSFIPTGEAAKVLARLGIPFALQSCAVNISMMFVTSLVNNVSVNASAVFGVGVKVDDLVNKITQGIGFANSAMVGQNIAAGRVDRVKKSFAYSVLFCAVAYIVFAVICLNYSEVLYGIFTKDEGVIALAPVFVSAIVWSFPAMCLMRGTNFIQGLGKSGLSLTFALIDGFLLRIGLSWFIGIRCGMGLYGFFLGYGLAAYGTAIPGTLYFLFGNWKKHKVTV